jgi:hypothetical protein
MNSFVIKKSLIIPRRVLSAVPLCLSKFRPAVTVTTATHTRAAEWKLLLLEPLRTGEEYLSQTQSIFTFSQVIKDGTDLF